MAQIKSQMKRIRTNEEARQRNASARSRIATESKKVRLLVEAGKKEEAAAQLKVALKLLDKSVTDHVYARNTVARKKAFLTKLVNSLE